MTLFGRFQKMIAAWVTGEIGWAGVVIAASGGNSFHVTASMWLAQAVVWATALGVFAVPNEPSPPAGP